MELIKRKECPEDYAHCEYYHPEQNVESRCIKDSKMRFCIIELNAWISVNKEFSNKLKQVQIQPN